MTEQKAIAERLLRPRWRNEFGDRPIYDTSGLDAERTEAATVIDELVEALRGMLAKHDERSWLSERWPYEAAISRAALARARGEKG
jgi:hypothetical protein